MSSTATDAIASLHPLDPLTASEVERAWEIVRAQQAPGPRTRVVFIMLHEPAKKVVLGHRAGDPVERSAFVVLVDSAAGRTYEAVVSLTEGRVLSWEHVPGVQPALVLDEFVECEAAVRADPRWQEAMRKRGVTDFALTMVDAWSAGNFGFPAGRRPPARPRAHVGAARSRRQWLCPAGRQRGDGRGPQRDEGARGRGRRRRGAAA